MQADSSVKWVYAPRQDTVELFVMTDASLRNQSRSKKQVASTDSKCKQEGIV
jgi:hypothetical protein